MDFFLGCCKVQDAFDGAEEEDQIAAKFAAFFEDTLDVTYVNFIHEKQEKRAVADQLRERHGDYKTGPEHREGWRAQKCRDLRQQCTMRW